MMKPMCIAERIAQIQAAHTADECWIWPGKKDPKGYCWTSTRGVNGDTKKRTRAAHRVVYERLVGPIPACHDLHHVCENPPCCNPKHLQPLTRSAHTLITDSASAWNRAKTHCPKGHEYTLENTWIRQSRSRERHCRACAREKARENYRRKSA